MNLRLARLCFALLSTLSLCACAARPSLPATETVPVPPTTILTALIPTITPTFPSEACGYQWAYQDLPAITEPLDAAVKALIPNSSARATAFGENCLGNDGQVVRFLTMETDFYVFIAVDTLDQYETFGNWIAQVMDVISKLPAESIPGAKPGFVAFRFEIDASQGIGLRVPIQEYTTNANGISGEALFRMFYQAP
jgi:hypothetical protein